MTAPRRPQDLWAAFDFPRHPLSREDGERLRGAFYTPPARRLLAHDAATLADVLTQAEAAARAGAWVLGGLRYEAALALDPALQVHASTAPLADFAIYESEPEPWPQDLQPGMCHTGPLQWQDSQRDADEAVQIERIREWIRSGDCYQVNLTTRLDSQAQAPDLAQVFLALHAQQPGGFSLFLRESGVASVSPELFFDWRPLPESSRTWLLAAQPMKGTAARGIDKAQDEAAQAHLRTSEKERAENLMIVDLLRNDLGRIAELGSVRVPRLFELHALPTVWQMTSTVTAVGRPGLNLHGVFQALFPCGSVTGAPKVRAMQIIKALEPRSRGWYCGALGLLQPGGAATFNVPIRTVEQRADLRGDVADHRLQCGIGSAITLDSTPAAEIAEWRAKTRFLLRAEGPFAALETMLLTEGHWPRLELHLARLQRCARHFRLRWRMDDARERLQALADAHPQGAWRVRLTVSGDGQLAHRIEPMPETPSPVVLALADRPLDSRGSLAEFVQHKTTRREHYAQFYADKPADAFDALLWNVQGELTECTFGNVALQIGGQWLTPHQDAGLLPGVMRESLLMQGVLREARLTLDDLARCQAFAFFNSARGWCPAQLLPQPVSGHDEVTAWND